MEKKRNRSHSGQDKKNRAINSMPKRVHEKEICSHQSELELDVFNAYEKLKTYVEDIEHLGIHLAGLKRLLDFNNEKVPTIWSVLNRYSQSGNVQGQVTQKIYDLMLFPHRVYSDWLNIGGRDIPRQYEAISNIGKNSRKLLLQIINAKQGHTDEFLRHWSTVDSKRSLSIDDILNGSPMRSLALRACRRQKEIFQSPDNPLDDLLIWLASLAKAADNYNSSGQEVPSVLVGATSQKATEVSYCVIRLHEFLKKNFGKAFNDLNAAIVSVYFGEVVTNSQVQEFTYNNQKKQVGIPSKKTQ